MSWGIYELDNGDVAVCPVDEQPGHELDNPECACDPQVEVIGAKLVITHNAFDFRHVAEWLEEQKG